MTKKNKKKRKSGGAFGARDSRSRPTAESLGEMELLTAEAVDEVVSDLVWEYGEFLFDEFCESDEDIARVIPQVCLFWNLSVIQSLGTNVGQEAEPLLMAALQTSPYFLGPAGAMNLIGLMTRRWQEEYSWCQRVIVDHWAELSDYGTHLRVVSKGLADLTAAYGE